MLENKTNYNQLKGVKHVHKYIIDSDLYRWENFTNTDKISKRAVHLLPLVNPVLSEYIANLII